MSKRLIIILFFILVLFYLLEGTFFVLFGNVWTDENWYFARSYLVTQGKLPYRDFFDYHLPLSTLIHAPSLYLFGPNLYVGRITSFFFSFLSVILTYGIAVKLAAKPAGLLVLLLNIVNLHAFHFATVMAAHSIEIFLVVLAIYVLMSDFKKPFNYIAAVALMSLANCVKYLTSPWVWALLLFITLKERRNWKAIFFSFITACAVMVLVLTPFILSGGERFFFGATWQLRGEYANDLGILRVGIIDRILYMVPIIQNYFLMYLLLPSFLIYAWLIRDRRRNILSYLFQHDIITLISLIVVLCSLMYSLLSPFRPSAVYCAFYFPVVALLLGIGIVKVLEGLKDRAGRLLVKVLITLLILLTPFLQPDLWNLVNIKWQRREMRCITKVAKVIAGYTQKDTKVFTFTPAFCASADREPLRGMESDMFSYYPSWSVERCKRFGLLNADILMDYLNKKEAGILVLTQNRFFQPSGRAAFIKNDLPQILEAIDANYYLKEKLPFPGVFRGDVYIYLPRK